MSRERESRCHPGGQHNRGGGGIMHRPDSSGESQPLALFHLNTRSWYHQVRVKSKGMTQVGNRGLVQGSPWLEASPQTPDSSGQVLGPILFGVRGSRQHRATWTKQQVLCARMN